MMVPLISNQLREFGFLPQILIGLVVLVLVFFLHPASQLKLLSSVSTALIAAASYVDRLEQLSFIDLQTQLCNRRHSDQLFNQQLSWLNRSGKSATLLSFELLHENGRQLAPEEIVAEAAFVLRSNFRGSDFIVQNSGNRFLVLLPDTTEDQAQFALNRLADKLHNSNLEHEKFVMMLRQKLSTCAPGGNLWETLRYIKKRLRDQRAPLTACGVSS